MHVSNFENECRKKSNRKKSHGKKVTDLGMKKSHRKKSHKKELCFFFSTFGIGMNFIFVDFIDV